MKTIWSFTTCLALLAVGACTPMTPLELASNPATSEVTSAHRHETPRASVRDFASDVGRVRAATARYKRLEVALAEGWTEQSPPGCAESPDGAQAFHYLNPSLVDGSVELLEPELLMYEPQADGSMELVGVDYVIPFDQWTGAEAPTLLDQPLMRNEPLEVWAIHIWAWRDNPSGLFAPWNPDVSCEHAK